MRSFLRLTVFLGFLVAIGFGPSVAGAAHRSFPAVVSSSTNWQLRDSLESDPSPTTFTYGTRPLVPIMGDWNGDGTATAGTYEAGVFKLNNANDSSAPDIVWMFGDRRGFPVAGDFDGDGVDDVAVYRNGLWQVHLIDPASPGQGDAGAQFSFTYGTGNWPATVPVAGDWDGDGIDGIGTYTLANGTWSLRQTASGGAPDAGSFVFWFETGSYPVVGDWDGNGTDTVGIKHTQNWLVNNENDSSPPDVTFPFGAANDLPLTWTLGHGAATLTVTLTPTPSGLDCRVTIDGNGLRPGSEVRQTIEPDGIIWGGFIVEGDGTVSRQGTSIFGGETTFAIGTTAGGDRITSNSATCPEIN